VHIWGQAADENLICLNGAEKLSSVRLVRFSNPMLHEPCRFLCHANLLGDLSRGHVFAGGCCKSVRNHLPTAKRLAARKVICYFKVALC
jgi:hypothetical protein